MNLDKASAFAFKKFSRNFYYQMQNLSHVAYAIRHQFFSTPRLIIDSELFIDIYGDLNKNVTLPK